MLQKFQLTAAIIRLLQTVLLAALGGTTPGALMSKPEFPPQCSQTCPWASGADLVLPHEVSLNSSDVNGTLYQIANNTTTVWCDGVNFQEPLVKLKLPKCKNITLVGNEFTIASPGLVVVSRGLWKQEFEEFQLSANNSTVSVCFRLSPQLQQCSLKRLDRRLYSYNTDLMALQNCRSSSDAISIRDYYTSPDTSDVIGCNVPIGQARGLRCNYIDLELSEFELSDGNASLRLLSNNVVISWPEYTVLDATHIKLCYPLSPDMTTCRLWTFKKHEFSITADHRLFSNGYNQHFDQGDYIINRDGDALFCKPKALGSASSTDRSFYNAMAILQIVSAVFVVVAVIIHILVPSLNYHAKPLLCHMISTAIMYICSSVRRMVVLIPAKGCYSLFVVFYFSSMTSFFWISVLAFDLWNIFAGMQTNSKMNCSISCDKGRKFTYYGLYAFGIPLLLVAFSVILDTQEPLQEALGLHPDIAMNCWFNERKSALALCYIPLFIVFVANIVLFVLTVFNLKNATQGVKIVNKKRNKQLLFVCIKIFCIMGLFSVIELITILVDARGADAYAADVSSAIQGIFLFVIYICKPATYRLIRKKFWPHSSSGTGTTGSKSNNRDSSGMSMESVLPADVASSKKTTESITKPTEIPDVKPQAEATL